LYGIDKMMCVKNKSSYELQGDFYSTEFRYLEVKLFKCNPKFSKNIVCKNETEIASFFEPQSFSFAFVNTYFDFLNYEKPIQYFLDDSLFFQLESDREKRANFYVMKAQIELQD
jgi:hypothetical protein